MTDASRTRGKVYVKIEHVTPEEASKLLKLNTHNRDLRISRVKLLVNAIKRGEWKLNGDCVVLSGNGSGGVLLNGQHRLYAIVESGISVDLALMYNAVPEAQETMDSGMPRSLAGKLKLRGEKYYSDLPSAMRIGWAYDQGLTPEPRASTYATTDQELIEYLDRNPALRETPHVAQALRKEFLSPGYTWAAWVFLFRREAGDEIADEFIAKLRSGADLPERSPVLALRRLLEKQRALSPERRFGPLLVAAMIVKAFNAFCLEQELGVLKWTSAEAFPRIVTREEIE